jgi:hypothetical protein
MKALAAVLLLTVLSGTSYVAWPQADSYPSGLDLIKRCHAVNQIEDGDAEPDEETVRDYGYCLGFVVGYVSGFAARDATGEQGRFCPPEDAKIIDFVVAIQNWLVEHPEGLDKLGAYVATQALQQNFPCQPR